MIAKGSENIWLNISFPFKLSGFWGGRWVAIIAFYGWFLAKWSW